jgi:hypothetical protein
MAQPARRRSIAIQTGLARGATALAIFGALALTAQATRATRVDPTLPTTVVVGRSSGIAPMGRIDGARRGRAHDPLPSSPVIVWRFKLPGGHDLVPIAVARDGSVLAASSNLPLLVQVSPAGKEQWRASTGTGPSVAGVALLNDETRLVVTSAGEAVGYGPNGDVRFRTPIELAERNARLRPIPLEDGGVAIGVASEVVELDGDGSLRARAHLPERLGGPLLVARSGIVATTQAGVVYSVRDGFVKRLGALGGDAGEAGGSTPDGTTLFAVVDSQRIVALNLMTGIAQTRLAVTDQSLHGPLAYGADDSLVLTSFDGALLTLARSAGDARRTSLDGRVSSLVTDAGRVDLAALDDSPPAITDADGRTAFARVGGRIGVVLPDGSVHLVPGATCASPAALAPGGARRMIVACRDGSLLMLGEAPP